METGISEELDYGWSPRFSPDGDEVAYARQVQPLTGQRALAATLAGNEVVVRGRKTNDVTVWATPSRDHHLFVKRWVDGDTLLAEDHAAVNGAWSGRLKTFFVTRPQRTLAPSTAVEYEVRRRDEGGRALVRISSAGESLVATYPASSQSFIEEVVVRNRKFVTIIDEAWWVGDTVSGKLTKRGAAPLPNDAYDPLVFFSPNGEWILFAEGPGFSDVYISRLLSKHARRVWSGPGQLKFAAWSPDSRHIALIVSRVGENDPTTSYAGDELLVFEFPARPASTEVAPYVKVK